jgi:hypothetical protein
LQLGGFIAVEAGGSLSAFAQFELGRRGDQRAMISTLVGLSFSAVHPALGPPMAGELGDLTIGHFLTAMYDEAGLPECNYD